MLSLKIQFHKNFGRLTVLAAAVFGVLVEYRQLVFLSLHISQFYQKKVFVFHEHLSRLQDI